jgi:GNAT superfamily N-acetyltransferase
MSNAEAIDRHRGALMSFARLTGRSGDDSRVIERDGVVASLAPAVPDRSILNSVGYRDAGALAAAVGDLAAAYDESGIGAWTVWVPEDDREASALLEAAGHRLDASPVAMVADLSKLPELEDEELDWDADAPAATVASVNDRAYGGSFFGPGISGLAAIDGTRLYQARAGGEAACVLVTYDNGDDCEVYMVATLPEHRGRGLARRLMHRALAEARDRGLAVSNLQSTKMGYPVYERLGYEPICTLEMWERRK